VRHDVRPWWHGAVAYEVYARSFADANNDGTGDLEGIRRRLPYLVDLGVDAVWITPFYPSPGFDHGYDVSDYQDVDPKHGSLDDFDRLVGDAHELGLRIIVDIVPNHSSSHHPWFREAVSGPGSEHRDYYIWRDPGPDGGPPNNWVSHFGGPAWTLDEASGQYYCHLFLPEQPDLNWSNPKVIAEFDAILRFWCERGVDGFRIDVAHGLAKDPWFRDNPQLALVEEGMDPGLVFRSFEHRYDLDQNPNIEVFRHWHEVVAPYEAVLLGEVGPEDPVRHSRYHDDGAAIHRNFYLTIAWMGWDPMRLRDRIRGIHLAAPDSTAWILDSHDTSHAATRFGGGEAGAHRALCAKTMMVCLGGMPVIYQGEELGIDNGVVAPENLSDPISTRNPGAVSGRDGARTVMPWGDGPTNGFNEGATPWMPSEQRGHEHTVAGQTGDPESFLERHRALLTVRRSRPELWEAPVQWLDTDDSVLMALRRGNTVVATNLDEHDAALRMPPGRWELLFASRRSVEPAVNDGTVVVPAETSLIFGAA
jgi:alpha-glucosidase